MRITDSLDSASRRKLLLQKRRSMRPRFRMQSLRYRTRPHLQAPALPSLLVAFRDSGALAFVHSTTARFVLTSDDFSHGCRGCRRHKGCYCGPCLHAPAHASVQLPKLPWSPDAHSSRRPSCGHRGGSIRMFDHRWRSHRRPWSSIPLLGCTPVRRSRFLVIGHAACNKLLQGRETCRSRCLSQS